MIFKAVHESWFIICFSVMFHYFSACAIARFKSTEYVCSFYSLSSERPIARIPLCGNDMRDAATLYPTWPYSL